jgi:hypothetical protein
MRIIFAFGFLIMVFLVFRHVAFTRRADKLEWPPKLPISKIEKYARRYLKQADWQLLPGWPWAGIGVRAVKNGALLNLLIADPAVTTLRTAIRDARELAVIMSQRITLLNYGLNASMWDGSVPMGTLMVAPHEFGELEHLIRLAPTALDALPDSSPNEASGNVSLALSGIVSTEQIT